MTTQTATARDVIEEALYRAGQSPEVDAGLVIEALTAAGFSIVDAEDMTVKIETLRRTAIMFGKTWSAPSAETMHVAERALHAALADRRDGDG